MEAVAGKWGGRVTVLALSCLLWNLAPARGETAVESAAGQSFLWMEINLVGFYSSLADRFDSTPRPQRTSAGIEYAGILSDRHAVKRLFGKSVHGVRFDLHPLAIYDPIEDEVELVLHDAWIELDLGDRRDTKLKIGHFLIPFGQNPVLEPRGFFLLPLSAADLGFKRDWGLSLKSRLGSYAYEVAVTAASGLGFHFQDDRYLLSARLGTPTYRDLQYGLSALYGKVPEIRAEELVSGLSMDRWRLAGDLIYKYGTYTLAKAEVAFGRDEGVPVAGYKLEVGYVLPRQQDWELKAQWSSWFNDLDRRRSDDTSLSIGLSYSLNTVTTSSIYYVHDVSRFGGDEDDQVFLQIHSYFRNPFR